MTNKNAFERLSEMKGGPKIEKLFWIAASAESRELSDFVDEFDDRVWKRLFPEIYQISDFDDCIDDGEAVSLLLYFGKLGFLAEVYIPQCTNFKFENDKLVSWAVYGGICTSEYVYAETLDGLIDEIERINNIVFEKLVEEAKKGA